MAARLILLVSSVFNRGTLPQQVRWTAMEEDPCHQFGASTCMSAHPYKPMYVPHTSVGVSLQVKSGHKESWPITSICQLDPMSKRFLYPLKQSHQLAQTHKRVGTLHIQNLPSQTHNNLNKQMNEEVSWRLRHSVKGYFQHHSKTKENNLKGKFGDFHFLENHFTKGYRNGSVDRAQPCWHLISRT